MRGVLSSAVNILVVTLLLSNFSHAQITPAPKPPTLFSFLGFPQGMQKLRGALTNRRGKHPKLEPKPPLKALADAANLESPVEAIKKAAEIKAAEDLKPQKIKAIKYLAKIGCGCYDKDGSITDALIAASDDPTPDVRLAVVEEVYKAANGACCAKCGATCCCNEKMTLRLAEMAYLRDDKGCYVEPNAEVRAGAVKALQACCPDSSPVVEISDEPKKDQDFIDEGADEEKIQDEGDEKASSEDSESSALNLEDGGFMPPDYIPEATDQPQPLSTTSTTTSLVTITTESRTASNQGTWDGVLMHVDPSQGIAHVHLTNRGLTLPIGSRLRAYGVVNGRQVHVGTLRVYETFVGSVNVQAVDGPSKRAIVKGVAVLRNPSQSPVHQLATLKPPVAAAAAATDLQPKHLMTAPVGQQVHSTEVTPRVEPSTTQTDQSKTSLGGLHGLLREVSSH